MHFTTIASTAAIIGSAMAGDYYYATTTHSEAAHMTTKVYTSVSTCTNGAEGKPTTSVYHYTTSAPAPYAYSSSSSSMGAHETPVTYTSYEHITVTSCAADVVSCPAKTYTSAHYSTTSTGSHVMPTPEHPVYSVPVYVPHMNMSSTPAVPYYHPTTTPAVHVPVPTTSSAVSMVTVYTTVCPGVNYCYGTTITTTSSPSTTPMVPVYSSSMMTPSKPMTSSPAVPVCPGGAYCPPSGTNNNATTPVYSQPPAATGAASSVQVSFGLGLVAAIAAFVAL